MSGPETGPGAIAGEHRCRRESSRGRNEHTDGGDRDGGGEVADRDATAAVGEESAGAWVTETSAGNAAATAPTVGEHVSVRRDGDGAVETTIAYEVPASVTKLAFWIERPAVTVVGTDGFAPSGVDGYTWQGSVDGPAFEWDGTTERPRVVLRHPLASSSGGAGATSPGATDASPTYGAGTDAWALLLRPRTHTRWRYRGTEPEIERAATVSGTGLAGDQFAFLGDYDCRTRRVGAERLRLVVPEAADPVEPPERILTSLAAASERLDVGSRSPVVTVFVAPTDGVEWAHRGLSLGPDARVNDATPLAVPTNIWIHEYVHTRQNRAATTPATEWLLEATAEYYAALLALERGVVDVATVRRVLERGIDGPAADAVLADPATWVADAQYRKGALVVAALDREIRAATDGAATFQAVVRAWNDAAPQAFDGDAFADAVETVGGAAARAAAIDFTQSAATPAWGEDGVAISGVGDAPAVGRGGDATTATALASAGDRREDGKNTLDAGRRASDRCAIPGLAIDEPAAD